MMRTSICALTAAVLLLAAPHVHGLSAWAVSAVLVLGLGTEDTWRNAALLGVVFGTTVALANVPWVADAASLYFHLSPLPALSLVLALALACGVPLGIVFGLGLRCAISLPAIFAAVAAGAVWASWEWLIRSTFPYYPWLSLAGTQVGSPLSLQVASLAGQEGLSFCIAAAGAAAALAFRRRRLAPLVVAAAVLATTVAWGEYRLHLVMERLGPRCVVSAVDARISSGASPPSEVLSRYFALSDDAARSHPDAIVWPESALPGFPELDPVLLKRLRATAASLDGVLIAGGPRVGWSGDWNRRLFNSAYSIAASGPVGVYDKRWLVPFAEYWPKWIPQPASLETQVVTPGKASAVFHAGRCRLGVLVCFEAERPELVQRLVAKGADAVLILSNDAELPAGATERELAQAQLRAVEAGITVVRAANRGPSVWVDPSGSVRRRSAEGVLSARIGAGPGAPAYRWSGVFLGMCWLVVFLSVAFALVVPRRH